MQGGTIQKCACVQIPVPSLRLVTPWLDVFPAESVKLSCGMNGSSGWTYTWQKDGQKVRADNVISFDSNGVTLSIKSASAAHAGQYNCKGHLNGRSVSSNPSPGLTLTVYDKEPTVTLTQDPDYQVMFPGEPVSFSCHINVSSGWEYLWYKVQLSSGWGYIWYKDGAPLHINSSSFNIHDADLVHSGTYKCMAIRGKTKYNTEYSDGRILLISEIPVPSLRRL
ncbi:hemicentin-1-like [Enoplosus armatus]|uniref:hemicentin-1-like n=1 Tax=Enoplosus armatus TaxID=215367 RepID=UPI003993CCDA